MKCPICKNQIEEGNLNSSGFAPAPIIRKKIKWQSNNKEISIKNKSPAYLCPNCKIITIKIE